MNKLSLKFHVEDCVEWSSQANGNRTTKIGMIVAVIPKSKRPIGVRRAGPARSFSSYVVAVPIGTKDFEFYWPLPGLLHLAARHAKLGVFRGY